MAYGLIQVDKVENSDGKSLNVGPSARVFDTVTELQASTTLSDGDIVIVKERANAEYVIQPTGYTVLDGDVALTSGQVAELQLKAVNDVRWWGVIDGTDDAGIANSALIRCGDLAVDRYGPPVVLSCQGVELSIKEPIYHQSPRVTLRDIRVSIHADQALSSTDFAITLGGYSSLLVRNSAIENFDIDAGLVCEGLNVDNTSQCLVSFGVVAHFASVGVKFTTKNTETNIVNVKSTQYWYGEDGYLDPEVASGICFQINTADSILDRCVGSYSAIGLQVSGGNTLATGCHFYTNTSAVEHNGGALHIQGGYIDTCPVVSNQGSPRKLTISGGVIFYSNVESVPYAINLVGDGTDDVFEGVTIVGNNFSSGWDENIVFTGDYNTTATRQCVIHGNGSYDSFDVIPQFGYEQHGYEGEARLIDIVSQYHDASYRSGLATIRWENNSGGSGSRVVIGHVESDTIGDSSASTPVGGSLGSLEFAGCNGTDIVVGSSVSSSAQGNWSSSLRKSSLRLNTVTDGVTLSTRWWVEGNGHFAPYADDTYNLGRSDLRPSNIFAANSTISTSDARLKTDLADLTDDEVNAAVAISKSMGYTWQWLENGDRTHTGPTVQLIMGIMEDNNLTPFDYSFICYDEWDEQTEKVEVTPAVLDDDGNIVTEAVYEDQVVIEAGDRYSFRENELIKFCNAGLSARLDSQQETIDSILSRLDSLEG